MLRTIGVAILAIALSGCSIVDREMDRDAAIEAASRLIGGPADGVVSAV